MTPGFAVFILMNNYFHDVATAMLLACGIALGAVLKPLAGSQDTSTIAYFSRLARGIERIAWFSVGWIIVSSIPRVLTFRTFEWPNAVEKNHEAGLIVKYCIAVSIAAMGAYLWSRASRRVRQLLSKTGERNIIAGICPDPFFRVRRGFRYL
jgi:hypothetical protein